MSHINDIFTQNQVALRASTTFATADIYQRGELPGDPEPRVVAVYMSPEKPRNNKQPDGQRFRIYPVRYVIRFVERAEANDDLMRSVPLERKSDYFDALIDALDGNNPGKTYPITQVDRAEWVDADLYFKGPDSEAETEGEFTNHRIMTLWEYHTYETT